MVRRLGSSILDLCQLAAGQYDAYISPGNRLKITDVCQPYALVKEAGGIMEVIPSFKNEVFYGNFLYECLRDPGLLNDIRFKVIAAGNKELLEEIKKYI
ncbi:MAG: hypothetical protein GXW85_07520 [Clostridia bacterium]|nr:hypothetical protein [Clostridia bacterium]